jgi:hypothetical protein
MRDVVGLAALVAAYVASIAFPLVVLPWILDRRGDLPYNSVASRLVAWGSFTALLVAVSAIGANGLAWDPWAWAALLGAVAFAAGWDIRDLKTRRIPRGRHPDA